MRVLARAAVLLISLLAFGSMPHAQTSETRVLASESFVHQVLGRSASTELSVKLEGEVAAGRSVTLHLDLDTAMLGGEDSEGRAALINGFVALACPPGVEPVAQPRPYWHNPLSGKYEFMYSKKYPPLERLGGAESAMDRAVGGGPRQMTEALSELSSALDPAVRAVGPADARLSGGDPSYTIGGVTWLIPVTVGFDELVNLFSEDAGLARETHLRISVPLRIEADAADPSVVIYMGGLSTAVRQAELLPHDIPETAIPLAPLPAPEPTQPAEDSAAAEGTERAGEDDPATPADSAEAAEPQPAPEPIPALVFSYKWVSFEQELSLRGGKPGPAPANIEVPDAQPELVEPAEATETEAAAEESGSALEFFVPQDETGESIDVGSGEASESSDAQEPAEQSDDRGNDDVAATEPDEGESVAIGSDADSVATAVEPGTIPELESESVIPLKPITNLAPAADSGGRQPISSGMLGGSQGYTAPPDLGEMILVPEGYFLLGTGESALDSEDDEHPQQQLFLPSFYIDKYLVTNRQFYEFALASGYKPEGAWERHFSPATADLPVRGVTWNDANSYARWAGKRLPTEAEWEKAMRGSDGRTYPWGEQWSASILPRGEFNYDVVMAEEAASPYGLLSTVGVLWQWTSSAYAPYPYVAEAAGPYKVLRGGCFSNGRNIVRCANRYSEAANVALNTFGFRCAKDGP